MSTGWTPCAQCASAIACITRGCAALAASPQPAAQPEQPEPGVLTDERLRQIHHEDQFGLFCDYDDFEQIARAIESEVLSTTRKRTAEQNARIMEAVRALRDDAMVYQSDPNGATERRLAASEAEVDRLLGGEA